MNKKNKQNLFGFSVVKTNLICFTSVKMKQFGNFKSGLHLNQLDITKACPFLCTFDINFIVLV